MQDQSSSSRTTVEANVFDLAPRVGLLGVLGAVALFAAFVLGQMPHPPSPALAAIGWLALFAADVRPQRRPRRTRVFCKPGSLQIAGGAKIRARDLVGATTARHDDRVSLMLAHRRRQSRPIVLDLPDEASLATICRALGIGHHGFGYVDLAVAPSSYTWLRLLSAAALVPFSLLMVALPSDLMDLAVALAVLGFFGWLVFLLGSVTTASPLLRLTPGGVFLPRASWNGAFIGFDRMEDLRRDRDRLVLTTKAQDGSTAAIPVQFRTSRWNRFAPTMDEVAHLESQLRAATDRAHGNAAPERAREAFAAVIERAPGEPLRDWLARVDAIAVGAQGYRSSATASRDELWSLLEDPDASPNARAAAARLLSRVAPDELRVRVADVLSTVRDERARVRIAASYDEDALHEEEQLERAEQLKAAP